MILGIHLERIHRTSVALKTLRCLLAIGALCLALGSQGYAQTPTLLVSQSSDRNAAGPLEGLTVSGDIYVFTSPDTGVDRVLFWFDDVTLGGSPDRTENNAPYDFFGGSVTVANPFKTSDELDGPHTISARLEFLDGTSAEVHAAFTIGNNVPALSFSPSSVTMVLNENDTGSEQVVLDTSDGVPASPTVDETASWLAITLSGSTTPITATFDVDTAGLAIGSYSTLVSAQSAGHQPTHLQVSLIVSPPAQGYELVVSTSPTRSAPIPLSGSTAQDSIYVFALPETGVSKVLYFLDDPGLTGPPHQTENNPPYDFNGGATGSANPLDTTGLANGSHTITAAISLSAGGTDTVHASFTVANTASSLVFAPDSISAALDIDNLQSHTVDLTHTGGGSGDYSIQISDPWLTVDAPVGTFPATLQFSIDTTGLAYGNYSTQATATAPGDLPATLTVQLSVIPPMPTQIHLAWADDPSTTLTVVWHTATTGPLSQVEYREAGQIPWLLASGAPRPSGASGVLHEVLITGLTADTAYEYRVPGDGVLSDIYTARTAPSPGPADFDFVYVADTGLIGRLDGLDTGTQQVIDEIAAIGPTLVLAGGDYAYFNTDTRFATLDDAIDAWFEQVQPIATRSPVMPTYGNHEVFLGEDYNAWADRFPTPAGFDGRRTYSFDVGDVHFISIFAALDNGGLRPGTVAWLDQDMADAQAAGQRWIVPFMHVAPFSDGANHPSSLALRQELGPLFESHGVQLVLTSHDQSYERTFPLVGVPDAITATSSTLSCYDDTDGITWLKVSPGGKLSNISGTFSPWLSTPAPSWTASRHNTLHHFAHVTVTAAGDLSVEVVGLSGDGSPPTIVDSFQYSFTNCPPELTFDTAQLSFVVSEDESQSLPLQLDTSNGTSVPADVQSSASWLVVDPTMGATPAALDVTADATGLTPGTYTGSVTATSVGLLPVSVLASLVVTAPGFNILVSTSPDRSGAVPLEGAVVTDDIYVHTFPDTDVERVRFYLDDPMRSGAPQQTENTAPYDFAGGSPSLANPFYSTTLSEGAHVISAEIELTDGLIAVHHASFIVANTAPALLVSPPSLTLAVDQDGTPVSEVVQLDTTGPLADFTVQIPAGDSWLSVDSPSGTTPMALQFTADPTGLSPGFYFSTVSIDAPLFTGAILAVSFEVIDNTPSLQFSSNILTFNTQDGGAAPPSQIVDLTAPGPADPVITVPADAPWLTVDPTGGNTPLSLTVSVDPSGLAVGSYQSTVNATAPGFNPAVLDVNLIIEGNYRVMVSLVPSRAGAVNLTSQVVVGQIYIFTEPDDPDIDFVEFWLDDPGMQGPPYRTENSAPYDLEGGLSSGEARPFNTENITDGQHTVTASFDFVGASDVVVSATFNVLNDAPSLDVIPGSTQFVVQPDETDSTTVTVTTTDGTTTPFTLDPVSVPWLALSQLDANTPGQVQIDVDSTGLSVGVYNTIIRATAAGYIPRTANVQLTVGTPGLVYFAGDDFIDTAVEIVVDDWYINGQITYPGRVWVNPANGQSRNVEGVMMNARLVQGVYDDLDGNIASSMSPWDPRANTEDYIANMATWRDHGLRAFNLCMQGGGNPGASSSSVNNNPYGADGRRCFDDLYAGLDTPYSQYLVRAGSVIRAADDLGMVVELCPFYWGQDQRLDDNDAVLAAMDGIVDWVLENGWTNVIIEVANEANWRPGGVWAFDHSLLQTDGSVTLMEHVKDRSSGPVGAHLPHGRLLVSVSGHGGYVPHNAWISASDYVIWHGNGQGVSSTASRLDQILARSAYQADIKPIYTNEQHTDTAVIDPHLQRHASWGYHGRNQYQRVFPTTDANRWTINKDLNWWNKLAEVTGSNP